ncbi:MAG: helix-turn-helix transcriptional regulator [Bacteroidota bacterium]
MRRYNRIKTILAEQERTNKWLADKMEVNKATVSRWCSNQAQPSLETLYEIAEVLDVDVCALLVRRGE